MILHERLRAGHSAENARWATNAGSQSTSTILCNSWGIADLILQIDTVAKEVKAFI